MASPSSTPSHPLRATEPPFELSASYPFRVTNPPFDLSPEACGSIEKGRPLPNLPKSYYVWNDQANAWYPAVFSRKAWHICHPEVFTTEQEWEAIDKIPPEAGIPSDEEIQRLAREDELFLNHEPVDNLFPPTPVSHHRSQLAAIAASQPPIH